MNTRHLLILTCTGIASPLILLVLLLDNGARLGWLDGLLLGPGNFVAHLFVPDAAAAHPPVWYFQVAFGLNFLFLWIDLLVLAFLLEKLITRRKHNA